jgi:hypothetical protein
MGKEGAEGGREGRRNRIRSEKYSERGKKWNEKSIIKEKGNKGREERNRTRR